MFHYVDVIVTDNGNVYRFSRAGAVPNPLAPEIDPSGRGAD